MPGRREPQEARREQLLNAAYAVALRSGIGGVTLRAVAEEAGVSHGLLVFHFERKDEVIGALLDRVLATTAMMQMSEGETRLPRSPDRVGALLRRELERVARDPQGMRVFFEYWALGVREPAIREKIAEALERYRAAFRWLAEEMLTSGPSSSSGDMTPEALAAIAVSLINGCAVQMMIDPQRFDTRAYLVAVESLLGRLAPAATERP
jgi:TetR/AcrR family transcriptional repressor of bet genes